MRLIYPFVDAERERKECAGRRRVARTLWIYNTPSPESGDPGDIVVYGCASVCVVPSFESIAQKVSSCQGLKVQGACKRHRSRDTFSANTTTSQDSLGEDADGVIGRKWKKCPIRKGRRSSQLAVSNNVRQERKKKKDR